MSVKRLTQEFSYTEALKNLRGKIAFPDLKIQNSHIRRAANGGILIEISGERKGAKADKLKEMITEVLGTSAKVTRPIIKGELRLRYG